MSPSTGLELDFGFGSLLDGGNVSATSSALTSGLSDFGGTGGAVAADYLSLSNLFDTSNSTGASTVAAAPSAASWQTKKTLMEQQLQQDQNSLNALLSQHSSATTNSTSNATSSAATATTTTPNPLGFATREELETLAAAAAPGTSQTAKTGFAPALAPTASTIATTTSAANGNNNYMFVATIVDPTQEDAPPQQMLFLPGSNQVIPMPTGTGSSSTAAAGASSASGISPMMALANLPVVFPQGSSVAASAPASANRETLSAATTWSSLQAQQQLQQQQQQQQGLLGLNGFSTGLNSLEDSFAAAAHSQALAPAPLDLSTLGLPTTSAEQQAHQLQQLPAFGGIKTETPLAPTTTPSATDTASKAAMPVRPLSAYNFFFSDERERILQNKTDENDVFDNAKKQRLLLAHLAKDRSKRRPHRKTHGKINFTTLSKLIGQRWKQLPDERKNFYREVAAIDLERYQRELRERSPQTTTTTTSPSGADFCT